MAELVTTLAATESDRLEQAEALVRGFCDWHIAPIYADSATLDGTGAQVFYLPTLRLVSVSSITEDGTAVDLTTVRWNETGRVWRTDGYCWTTSLGGLVVTFDHGYDSAPAEVTGIIQAVAQRAIDNPGSRVSTTDGPFSDSFARDTSAMGLLQPEKSTLRAYRIPAQL